MAPSVQRTYPGPAATAACVYVLGMATALTPDLPLLALALGAVFVALTRPSRPGALSPAPVRLAVAFVAASVLSTVASIDPWRSVRLSAPLIPGILLAALIVGYFDDDDLRALYVACSALALWVAATILWTAWRTASADPTAIVSALASPLVVVPNDGVLLVVVVPLSVAVMRAPAPGWSRGLAMLSIATSIAAVTVLQSRIAGLAAIAGAVALGGRGALRAAGAAMLAAVAIDGVRGFPFAAKLAGTSVWNTRFALWMAALEMFRDAPVLGHGPHSFGVVYRPYLAALRLPSWLPVDERIAPWPHNLFLEALAEVGVLGGVTLVLLLAVGLAAGWRLRPADPFAAGAFGALAAFAIAACAELTLLRHWVVIFLLTLTAVIVQRALFHPLPHEEFVS